MKSTSHGIVNLRASTPNEFADERVVDIKFTADSLSVSLKDGRNISVHLAWFPKLLHASESQRKNWKVAGGGYGIHWPEIDEDLSTEGLLRGAPSASCQAVSPPAPVPRQFVLI